MVRLRKLVKPWQKQWFHGMSAILWFSGAAWLYFQYYGQVPTEFGPQAHPAQVTLLEIHGAAAMGFLMTFGLMLNHMSPGWRKKYRRPSGASLLVICGFLILSGWALYYAGHEKLRNLTSIVHSLLGIFLPAIIFWHVWTNRHKPKDFSNK